MLASEYMSRAGFEVRQLGNQDPSAGHTWAIRVNRFPGLSRNSYDLVIHRLEELGYAHEEVLYMETKREVWVRGDEVLKEVKGVV